MRKFWTKELMDEASILIREYGSTEATRIFNAKYNRKVKPICLVTYLNKNGYHFMDTRRNTMNNLDEKLMSEMAKQAAAERQRLASDHEALKPGDGDYRAPDYDREKKQEYNESMAQLSLTMKDVAADPEKSAAYVSLLAENERRWQNKRLARSTSIGFSREVLMARQYEQIAQRVRWDVPINGYAKKAPRITKRAQVLILSDLHIGAHLPSYENPEAFDFTAAGRRLAHLAIQTAELKPQYRDDTHLVLGLNGDIIEGLLGWNDADNFPFAEQMVAATQFLSAVVAYLASAYPTVEVYCQSGNHGRNKLVHQGRATSSKWNSLESVIYKQIQAQCRPLKNVRFDIPKSPWCSISIFGTKLLMTHGDTELKLKPLDASGGLTANEAALTKVQTEGKYGKDIGGIVFGHFHRPGMVPTSAGWIIAQGALVPPNGHARTAGFSGVCGFYAFEATPGFLVGDSRFLRVGPEQDSDDSLDTIVPPFNPW